MNLLQLQYFLSVAKNESITKAAEEFLIPQPAMSRAISRLESELGVKLFDRRNNVLFLNEKGRLFRDRVEKALWELKNGVEELKDTEKTNTGSIKLLVNENQRFIQECVIAFAKENPEVNFSVCHDYSNQDIQEYDIAVVSEIKERHMNGVPLIKEKIVLAVNEMNDLSKRGYVELKELQGEKFITTSERSSLYSTVVNNFRIAGIDPVIPFIFDDPYFVRKYISENLGIALVPSISWRGRFRANTVLIDVINPDIYSTSYLIWKENQYHSRALRSFVLFVLNLAASIEGNLAESDTANLLGLQK